MHRATIFLGWGDFGREVLRRLLVTAALRDALSWEVEGDGAWARRRRLLGLELFHLGPSLSADTLSGETDLELLADLEIQIRSVDPDPQGGGLLATAVVEAAKRLLAPKAEAAADTRPPGLDLLVVAHPQDREALGRLEAVMEKVFAALGQLPTLRREVAGAAPLATVVLLDVDNEGDDSTKGRAFRDDLGQLVSRWESRRRQGELSVSRVYVSGEMGRQVIRGRELRLDEITLFLELLLFEGRRHEALKRLFQPQQAREGSLGTFGVRLFEHPLSLLKRLAAAAFGAPWLRYLAGDTAADNERPRHGLGQALAPFHPVELDRLLGWDEVRAQLRRDLDELEAELSNLPPEREDWFETLRARAESRGREIEARLHNSARQAGARLAQSLAPFSERLEEAVTAALRDTHRPLPLGAVLAELLPLRQSLAVAAEAPAESSSAGSEPFWRRLGELSRHTRVPARNAGSRRGFWLTLAMLSSLAWVGFVREALQDLPAAGPLTSPLVRALRSAAATVSQPLPASLALFALAAAPFLLLFAPAVERRLAWHRRLLTDRPQGRLSDSLRAGLAPSGALSSPLEALAERLRRDLAAEAAGAFGRELDRALDRLRELAREARWLAGQLERFHALYSPRPRADVAPPTRAEVTGSKPDRGPIRRRAEQSDELAALLSTHPAEPALFRAVQAEGWVFESWRQAGASPFLFPLELLERIAQRFDAEAGGGVGVRASELIDFLGQHGGSGLAFDWRQQLDVNIAERFALLPRRWLQAEGVHQVLAGAGIHGERCLEAAPEDRAYLLNLQLGMNASLIGGQR